MGEREKLYLYILAHKVSGPKLYCTHVELFWETCSSILPVAINDYTAENGPPSLKTLLTTAYSAWTDNVNPAVKSVLIICHLLKAIFFLPASGHMDVSIFFPIVLKANFSVKFLSILWILFLESLLTVPRFLYLGDLMV